MTDIVERLRDPFPSNRDAERKEAANEIERLRNEIERLRIKCNEVKGEVNAQITTL